MARGRGVRADIALDDEEPMIRRRKASAGVSMLGSLAATGVTRQVTQARAGLDDPFADIRFDSMYREPDRCVITDDGVRLAARVVNDVDDPDLTVVFVHGFSLRMSSWYFQRTALAPTWGERTRLVFYDHRGHGRSDAAPPQTMTMSQLGDDLALVLRALAPTGPVVVVGHSMGGMATMALARRHPALFAPGGRVVGVGLVATAARGITEAGVGEGLQNPVINAFRLAVRRAPWFIQAGRTRARRALEPVLLAASFGPDFYSPATARAVEALLADGGVVDHAGLFAGLWGVIGELRELIDRRFVLRAELEPSLAGYANADDSCRGELRAYRGATLRIDAVGSGLRRM